MLLLFTSDKFLFFTKNKEYESQLSLYALLTILMVSQIHLRPKTPLCTHLKTQKPSPPIFLECPS